MALLDRITHNAIILNTNGKSYRKRQETKKWLRWINFSLTSYKVFENSIKLFSRPRVFRTDNGSEFRYQPFNLFLSNSRIKHEFIDKGKPYQNGFSEGFNFRFDDECLKGIDFDLHDTFISSWSPLLDVSTLGHIICLWVHYLLRLFYTISFWKILNLNNLQSFNFTNSSFSSWLKYL